MRTQKNSLNDTVHLRTQNKCLYSLVDKKYAKLYAHIYCVFGHIIFYYLRNEFDFWNIPGTMNMSGLLQS